MIRCDVDDGVLLLVCVDAVALLWAAGPLLSELCLTSSDQKNSLSWVPRLQVGKRRMVEVMIMMAIAREGDADDVPPLV